ncbi:MAG: carboxypeptidase-like regulatory domain-containing protein [Bacteroidetes bacterium]|nr:carboxypeptidase-like regulatory domain-containing protein [Bacteroidota bacterium]
MRVGKFIISCLLSLIAFHSFAQKNTALVYGKITDLNKIPVKYVNITWDNNTKGTISDESGYYEIEIPANKTIELSFSYVRKSSRITMGPLKGGSRFKKNVTLDVFIEVSPFEVKGTTYKEKSLMQKVDTRALDMLPSTGEKVIAVIKTFPGVSSSSELSSSYSVRGGNYDENLVYINDIEIYRPFLIRSGQQEGLPIINSDLVESLKFSAGGFEAKYGDKLSSVLDIKYKQPKEFAGNVTINLLGASAHLEGRSKNLRFSYLMGARKRSTRYLLNTLDTKGDYNTSFTDFQSYFTYQLSPEVRLDYFSYFGRNSYNLIPETKETSFGTHELTLRLKVYFDGQEVTAYDNYLNAITLNMNPKDSLEMKFIASVYNTYETEYFDIQGQYWLNQVDTDPGSETFNDSILNLGVGTYLDHARNRLYADIFSLQFKYNRQFKKSELKMGVQAQHERITDYLREWRLIDSAGYSIPVDPKLLIMDRFLSSTVELKSFRYSGYLQNTFMLSDSGKTYLTAGFRTNYWDYNNELSFTPRIQFVTEPFRKEILRELAKGTADSSLQNKKNIQFKAALGMYYQPPFYRELRDRQGILNPEIRSQKSYQAVIGTDVYFRMFGKTFKWMTEAYFKYLTDIIPYDIEDIRIRYFAKNNAVGYATGIDMQIYGEFVGKLPSWLSLSLLKTMEDVDDDYFRRYDSSVMDFVTGPQGFIPRPTDQRFMASILFQDFLPKIPTSKVHLNLVYGTSLPFGPPQYPYLRNLFRMRAYKRIDIGFSKLLVSRSLDYQSKIKFLNQFESIWISGEIFNMFGFENVISYFWIKDVNNNMWGVPNYLTQRRFNVSMTVKF